jgi:hypothetical protein
MTANILRGSLPYGLSSGEGSASSSSDSSLSSSMNRSRTSTGDSSLSTETNGSARSGSGIPPTPPVGQVLSSSSTITNTTRRRSHRPRGCRGGRKNRKKNSQSNTTGNPCPSSQQAVPTEIVGSIPLSPRDGNTQSGHNIFNNRTLPSKASHQPHAHHLEMAALPKIALGPEAINRNIHHVANENTHNSTMTTNTTSMVAGETHSSVLSSLLSHPQPMLAGSINNMSTGQLDQYTRHAHQPNPNLRFQHHPSHTFIAHPMSYDRSISGTRNAYYHNDGDFHQNTDPCNNNINNKRHQQQPQQPQSTTDRHFDPSRSVDAMATKSIEQLNMLAASKNNKINMGSILPPLPSTKREDSPVHTGPNPYALTNADQGTENTSPVMMASATTTTFMHARSSNESAKLNIQTMNLHHIVNAHIENNDDNCLSSRMPKDCYRDERLEKQRQMLADGGSLFAISPRSFLNGVKVQTMAANTTTTTAW